MKLIIKTQRYPFYNFKKIIINSIPAKQLKPLVWLLRKQKETISITFSKPYTATFTLSLIFKKLKTRKEFNSAPFS